MAMNTRLLVDNVFPVFGAAPKDYNGAASTGDLVNLSGHNHVSVVIQTGAWAGGTAAVTLNQATAVGNTAAKALGFTKMWTNRANTSSSILVETAVSSNTFSLNTANAVYVIEVDTATLDATNNFDCFSCDVGSPSSNADLYAVMYFLSGARFPQAQGITDPIA